MGHSIRRRALLGAWIGTLALLAHWNATSIRPSTDLSQFLPRGASVQDDVLLSQIHSGVAARTLLLRIVAAPSTEPVTERLAAASRAMGARLRDSGDLVQVANGELALGAGRTDPALFRYRYLVGPPEHCADALDEPALRAALQQRLAELATGLAMLDKQRLTADPTACYRALLQSLVPGQRPSRSHGVWFSADGRHALLVAVTGAHASDLAAQRRAVKTIEQAFATLPERTGLSLELAGPGYFAVGSERRIKTETILLSTAASIIVALLLTMAFRSAALVALGLLPLASGLLAGSALVSLLFGSVHGITLALGVTLLGVALDYPVHVFAHAAGTDPDNSRPVWRTLWLGTVTTVLGYAALAWTNFDGLSQLGVLAAAGLTTSALTSRYLLPLLIPPGYRLPELRWLNALQQRRPRLSLWTGAWLLLGSLAALGLTLLVHGNPLDTDIRRLSVVPESEIDKDRIIRAQLGAPDVARLLYVIADDEAKVLERLEAAAPDLKSLEDRNLIGGFDSAARWLPSPRTQGVRRDALPGPEALSAALTAGNAELPFRLQRLQPFLDDVERSRSLAALRATDLAGSLVGTRTAMLLSPLDGRWLGLVPLSGVDEVAAGVALEALAARHGMTYLDLSQGTAELLSRFFATTSDKLLIAAAVIVLTLALALRSAARLARVLLPIGLALVLSFALVILLHGAANLFHLVSLLLVAGLAVDYSLFLSRPVARAADSWRTLFSVSVGAGSSFAMFAMLALSTIPALKAIGFTVAVGILCAYASSLLLARTAHERLQ
ncbi:MAG: MMPL family transporter [Thiohalocapsa sp.]